MSFPDVYSRWIWIRALFNLSACFFISLLRSAALLRLSIQKKDTYSGVSLLAWQRPTLTGGSPQLPSAQKSLTTVFGMGTGVTSLLLPPDYFDVRSTANLFVWFLFLLLLRTDVRSIIEQFPSSIFLFLVVKGIQPLWIKESTILSKLNLEIKLKSRKN